MAVYFSSGFESLTTNNMVKKEAKTEIRASRQEWDAAMNNWVSIYKRNLTGNYLLEDQYSMYFKLKENIKSLNGEPVVVIKSTDGGIYTSYPYKGMILNAKPMGDNFSLTVFFTPTDREPWNGERIEAVQLFQVIPVRAIEAATEEQKKEMRFFNLLNAINGEKNKNAVQLDRSIREHKELVVSLTRDIERYERKLTELEEALEKSKANNLTVEGMLDSFRELGKNKKIFNAFVTDAGKMVVETEMIYVISSKAKIQKEDKRKKVGRLVFELTTKGISTCRITNLDYCFHEAGNPTHYSLPHVADYVICRGSNEALLDNLAKAGSFYELADFLILFFSLFPHDSGIPRVNHGTWYKNRVRELKKNPFTVTDNRKIWELYPGKIYAQSPEEKKALMFEELEAFANNREHRVAPVRQHITFTLPTINPAHWEIAELPTPPIARELRAYEQRIAGTTVPAHGAELTETALERGLRQIQRDQEAMEQEQQIPEPIEPDQPDRPGFAPDPDEIAF